MPHRTVTRSLTNRELAPALDRRRQPRYTVYSPVALRWAGGVVEGYTVNLSYFGALIRAPHLPQMGSAGDLVLFLEGNRVFARVRVVRIDAESGRFAVEFTQVLRNGPLLMQVLATAEERAAT